MTRTPRRLAGRRALSLGAAAAALFGAAAYAGAADWPTLRGDDRHSGVSTENVAPPLSLLWRHTGARLGNNSASPAIVGDTVYFVGRARNDQGAGGAIIAVDVKTGARKWVFPGENGLTNRALFTTSPTVVDGSLYVGASDGNLYMVDANSGREVRRFRTGASISSTPLVRSENGKDVLYFGSNDRKLYAIDPETGTAAWTQGKNQALIYNAGDVVNSSPIYADNNLFFTTADQRIHSINATTGRLKYALRLPFRFLPNGALYARHAAVRAQRRAYRLRRRHVHPDQP
jgi:outer membrane protein assembly factor BamB